MRAADNSAATFHMQAGTLITPRLAEEAIHSRLTCLPIESLPLTQCVGGTLRENVYAERDHPPFDRVTMDGIAVDSAALRRGLRRFRIQATQAAGTPPIKLGASDDAIEVMTGAILPLGSDCVIPVEQLDIADAGQSALAQSGSDRVGVGAAHLVIRDRIARLDQLIAGGYDHDRGLAAHSHARHAGGCGHRDFRRTHQGAPGQQ